jgi:hypothetical protein
VHLCRVKPDKLDVLAIAKEPECIAANDAKGQEEAFARGYFISLTAEVAQTMDMRSTNLLVAIRAAPATQGVAQPCACASTQVVICFLSRYIRASPIFGFECPPFCNYGRLCAMLTSNVAAIMIREGLAVVFRRLKPRDADISKPPKLLDLAPRSRRGAHTGCFSLAQRILETEFQLVVLSARQRHSAASRPRSTSTTG